VGRVPKNNSDPGTCLENGMRAEELFEELVVRKGGIVKGTSTKEDARDHQDRFIWNVPELGEGRIAVDIRARPDRLIVRSVPPEIIKACNMANPKDWDAFTLMEIVGRGRKRGRIFGTQADYFAQERRRHFDIYTTCSLRKIATRVMEYYHFDKPVLKNWKTGYEPFKFYLRLGNNNEHSGEFFFIPTMFLNIWCTRMNSPPIQWLKS
jgi:hypothetical protein